MQVEYEQPLVIATAKSRFDKTWHNQKINWSELLDVLHDSHETNETAEEYANMTKAQRGEVKDVGGFVGGYLKDGRRQKGNVIFRTLVTIDMDNAPKNYEQYIHGKLDRLMSYCVYSTHSFTLANPRVRIVIPLKEKVSPDEYVAVTRWVCNILGMKYIDPTTCAPERLMYKPSHPKGSSPVFWIHTTVPILDAKKVLNDEFIDWHDQSTWPTWEGEGQIPAAFKPGKKADPLTRPGWVGAFNRAHTIADAIEMFLSDMYGQFKNRTDRYTYLQGSSVGGVHLLNPYLAYSFQATDPISQKCVNAFDFVRIARFWELDVNAKETAKGRGLPSYHAMVHEICMNDEKTKLEIQKGPEAVRKSDFDDSLVDETATPDAEDKAESKDEKTSDIEAWRGQLDLNDRHMPKPLASNILLILNNDSKLKDRIAYDLFSNKTVKKDKMPWEHGKVSEWRIWTDNDDACLRNYLSNTYSGLQCRQIIDDCLKNVAMDNKFHPVIEWLEHLPEWDKKPRVERLFVTYLGAKDTEYNRKAARLLLRMAIARVYHPGVKCDTVIVLVGGQGIGKSTLLAKLGGKWFSDNLTTVQGKEAIEQLQGNWIIEMGEMQAQKKADNEAIKSFISRQVDKVRMAYAHNVSYYPRQCILVGTTNNDTFLKDYTGNRRFMPVDVAPNRDFEPAATIHDIKPEEVEQIWAEALADFEENYHGESDLLFPKELQKEVAIQQDLHMEGRDNFDQVASYLNTAIPKGWYGRTVDWRADWMKEHMGEERMAPGKTWTEGFGNDGIEHELEERKKVCVKEIAIECFGAYMNDIPTFMKNNIRNIMRTMPGWKWCGYDGVVYVPGYNAVRVFRKIDTSMEQESLISEKSSTNNHDYS